jgi:hypothetical protein
MPTGKRWQLRPAHHLIDAGVEVGVAGAGKQGVIENATKTIDPEAQANTTLLAALPGGIRIVFVGLEPGADHRPVLCRKVRRRHRGGHCLLHCQVS